MQMLISGADDSAGSVLMLTEPVKVFSTVSHVTMSVGKTVVSYLSNIRKLHPEPLKTSYNCCYRLIKTYQDEETSVLNKLRECCTFQLLLFVFFFYAFIG